MLSLWSAGGEYVVQDLAIFALTAVVGLLIILVVIWFYGPTPPPKPKSGKQPARWGEGPADKDLGDLQEVAAKGSLHQYLYHLHDRGHCPVTSFWWGKQQVVSVCSPQGFKDTVKLTDRPGQLFAAFAPLMGESSIQYANGTDWEDRRKCLYGVFKGENLLSYFPHLVQIAKEVEEAWAVGGPKEHIPLVKSSFSMTIKGIARCIFGKDLTDQDRVNELIESYMAAWHELEEYWMKQLENNISKRMEGLLEKMDSRFERMEGRIEELVMEGRKLKENKVEEKAERGKFAGLPTHNAYTFALSAISVLFSDEELGGSLLFKSKKSEKPGLEPKRVEIFLGELDKRFAEKWNVKTLKSKINQKCRDIANKLENK